MTDISRRKLLGGGTAAAVAFPFISTGSYQLSAAVQTRYSKRAVDIVRESLIIDMLAPIKIDFDPKFYASPMSPEMEADFRASGITGFHHAVGTGGRESVLTFLATWGNYVARHAHLFVAVDNVTSLVRAKRDGKCAVIMGTQNAEHFQRPADVKFFYELGQRVAQLTYNSQNRLGSGSTERVDGGVSDFGVSIIKAMNDVGMLVDVSHSGDRTTLDAIELSPKPIAITHSNCRALIDHPRVKTDEAIRALGKKGGVMGITGVRNFVNKTDPTNITHIADHIDHVVKVAGMEHVGIGTDSDLWGYDDTPPELNKMLRGAYKDSYAFRDKIDVDGFDHPRKMFDLAEELIRRRYSNENIKAVFGGNFQRLLTSTWGG